MKAFSVNHITSSLHYPQSNGLAEKYVQIVKSLFYKAKEESKHFYRGFMIYCNTPLTGSLQLPIQILQGRSARSDLPMSNAARKQFGIQPEVIRNIDKHEQLPTHDLHVGKHIMYQYSASKLWYPAMIENLCPKTRSYNIKTSDCVLCRKMQVHLKPYTPQNKMSPSTKCVSPLMAQSNHMWPVKPSDHKKSSQVNNHSQIHTSRPKRDTKPPVQLDLLVH